MEIDYMRLLLKKLNRTCLMALEDALQRCQAQTNYEAGVEHWILALLNVPNSDFQAIFRHYEIESSRVVRDLTKAIDLLKTGNSRDPAYAPEVESLLREAWYRASFTSTRIRSGHLLLALLEDHSLSRLARELSSEFASIPAKSLRNELAKITANTVEEQEAAHVPTDVPPGLGGSGPRPDSKTPGLDQFTIDLTARAREGKLDPVIGRDSEIRKVIDILTRRRQNNPILTGEAGVGKTAVVEGFAQRIVDKDVPLPLQSVRLLTLDLGLLQAGAGVRGEFEKRLQGVIEEVKGSAIPIILFIDEAHQMIGAGGQAGQGDAANLLKPALARGELRTIAATTWAEYKKYFEQDAALARRFQVVKVEEPDEPTAVTMMRGVVKTLEKHHNVQVLDEAVADSVRLSRRYLSGRQLPDKSFSVLDTACGKVALGQNTTPPAIEDGRRRVQYIDVAIGILEREAAMGAEHADRLKDLKESRAAAEAECKTLEKRWQEEAALIQQIRELRIRLANEGALAPDAKPVTAAEGQQFRDRLASLNEQLKNLQGETPLMHVCVDSQSVAQVIAGWTGIPVGRMVADEVKTILSLRERLEQRIIGQSHALEAIAQAIRTSRASMTDPRKPIGVFLLVGSSGVGKTETALALAELLYGGEQNTTTINMSEFKEEHKVSLLMGSPPGYVGYGEGGVLTEAVRRKPYSVLLLDEMEKAHPGVQDIFYQVFDKGQMKDGQGRDIDFKNTIILMTSNAGTDLIMKLCADPETRPNPEGLGEALHPELLKTFKPAFLGRVTVVPFFPLSDDVMRKIIELQLGRIARRIKEACKASFTYSPEVISSIAERCKEVSTGGRNVDHILTRTLLPEISAEFLAWLAEGKQISSVRVELKPGSGFAYTIT